MAIIKIKLINDRACIINLNKVQTLRHLSEDDDGDCELQLNGTKIGYVHGEDAAKNLINNIGKLLSAIEFDNRGNIVGNVVENYEGELWK